MSASKSSSTALNAVTTTQVSSAIDVSATYENSVYVSIVQVGTATTAAKFKLQISCDGGTTYFDSQDYNAGLAATTYSWPGIPLPDDATHVKVSFTQQSGGTSSTCTAQVGKLAGL